MRKKWSSGLRVEWTDRHGEHARPEYDTKLCEHGDWTLYPGDLFKGEGKMGDTTFVEIELFYVEDGKIRVTLNHLDYIIEREQRKLVR